MSWKFLTFSVFFTDIFLLFLMFYLGYDFETFKKVALAETLLVIIALIFDSMEQYWIYQFPQIWRLQKRYIFACLKLVFGLQN